MSSPEPAPPTYFEDVKAYIEFGPAETEVLRAFLPAAAPHFERISQHFYDCILRHPNAHAAITGGHQQVERLKQALVGWMRSGLDGPHDEAFFERRARIGRIHVAINLPQRYMFTAMNVMRLDFRRVVEGAYHSDSQRERQVNDALDKLFDLELAIMLYTYQEDSEQKILRRERLATIGHIAAGIAHDLRNPLGVIDSSLYLLNKRAEGDKRMSNHLAKIGEQVRQCASIIDGLLGMVRERPVQRRRVAVRELFEKAIRLAHLGPSFPLSIEAPSGAELDVEPELVCQALVNVLTNAADAYGRHGGAVVLRGSVEEGATLLEVFDEGPGFTQDVLSQVFEPLVTSRPAGIGLGLALVKSIVERHGGRVSASNRPQGGASIQMRFPR